MGREIKAEVRGRAKRKGRGGRSKRRHNNILHQGARDEVTPLNILVARTILYLLTDLDTEAF